MEYLHFFCLLTKANEKRFLIKFRLYSFSFLIEHMCMITSVTKDYNCWQTLRKLRWTIKILTVPKIVINRLKTVHFREWRVESRAGLSSDVIKQVNTYSAHREQVCCDVRHTHTPKGLLLLCLSHRAMHIDLLYDIDRVHTTPWEWRAYGGGSDYPIVTDCILFVGLNPHSRNLRSGTFDWKVWNFITYYVWIHIAISKNVVRENDECQLSNGDCTTEKKCGYWILIGNKLQWCRLHTVPTFDGESYGFSY